ncbi:uncharacterized protein LOC144599370 [Rhinoraja longicauda]
MTEASSWRSPRKDDTMHSVTRRATNSVNMLDDRSQQRAYVVHFKNNSGKKVSQTFWDLGQQCEPSGEARPAARRDQRRGKPSGEPSGEARRVQRQGEASGEASGEERRGEAGPATRRSQRREASGGAGQEAGERRGMCFAEKCAAWLVLPDSSILFCGLLCFQLTSLH